MLPLALVEEIDRLLKAGQMSQRKIAVRLGVSRGTVSAIASGHRALFGKEPRDDEMPLTPSSPPVRCPGCGYRVYMPCRICYIRRRQAQRQAFLGFNADVNDFAASPQAGSRD
jgi:hypothetical protein